MKRLIIITVLVLVACSRHDDLPPVFELIDPPMPTDLRVETVDNITFLLTWEIADTSVVREYWIYSQIEILPGVTTSLERIETEELVDITRSSFCMQCHGRYNAPDGETIQCNTLSGSYQNTYVAQGGSQTCQDCHMKKGHYFPGGHDLDIVKEGLGLQVEIVPYGHLPGTLKKKLKEEKKWIPSAVVNVFVENKTGHRIPDG